MIHGYNREKLHVDHFRELKGLKKGRKEHKESSHSSLPEGGRGSKDFEEYHMVFRGSGRGSVVANRV